MILCMLEDLGFSCLPGVLQSVQAANEDTVSHNQGGAQQSCGLRVRKPSMR